MIEKIYIGTWTQRTAIHLREVFYFLRDQRCIKGLDQNKIQDFWQKLNISNVSFHSNENGFDYITANLDNKVLKITEDGIIYLSYSNPKSISITSDLEYFYLENVGPALDYLFSLGAPLPKLLSTIEVILPRIVILNNVEKKGIVPDLLKEIGEKDLELIVEDADLDAYVSEHSILFILKTPDGHKLEEELLESMVFSREFNRQLDNYLQIHRQIWEKVSVIREAKSLSYRNFPKIKEELMDVSKSLNFIEARINQMDSILELREKRMSSRIKKLTGHFIFGSFETFHSTLSYTKNLWLMTEEYVRDAVRLIDFLTQENINKELRILQLIAALGFIVGFFGMNVAFPWDIVWETSSWSLFLVTAVIVLFIVALIYLLNRIIQNRKFFIKHFDN